METETKWPPFGRRRFQINCFKWKLLYLDSIYIEMYPKSLLDNHYVSISSYNGLASTQQATNHNLHLFYWRIYVSRLRVKNWVYYCVQIIVILWVNMRVCIFSTAYIKSHRKLRYEKVVDLYKKNVEETLCIWNRETKYEIIHDDVLIKIVDRNIRHTVL